MSEILVKKVKPCDLPNALIFRLNRLYKTELGQFVTMYDTKTGVLYVNERIREKDIERFVTAAGYEGKYINSPDCEIAGTIDYICKKYGYNVCDILFKAYMGRRKKKENEAAKKNAEELYKIIHDFETDDASPDVFFDKEVLILHLGSLAEERGQRTAGNIVSYRTRYAFLFGYLLGSGIIKEEYIG